MARFLSGSLPLEQYLAEINGRSIEYAGFNLLVGTREELWHYNARDSVPTQLPAGVYGLSNAGLDTPWPKLLKAKAALGEVLENPQPETLLDILSDPQTAPFADLPDTGVGLATESLLSSVFIASPSYGTRASTALIVNADGTRQMVERSFGPQRWAARRSRTQPVGASLLAKNVNNDAPPLNARSTLRFFASKLVC